MCLLMLKLLRRIASPVIALSTVAHSFPAQAWEISPQGTARELSTSALAAPLIGVKPAGRAGRPCRASLQCRVLVMSARSRDPLGTSAETRMAEQEYRRRLADLRRILHDPT